MITTRDEAIEALVKAIEDEIKDCEGSVCLQCQPKRDLLAAIESDAAKLGGAE